MASSTDAIPTPHTRPTLYHIQYWSSSRVLQLIKELHIDDQIDVRVIDDTTLKSNPELLARNPCARLPYFESGKGFSMVESSAIMEYLLETYDTKHTLHPAPIADPANGPVAEVEKRAKFLQFLHYAPGSAYHVVIPVFFKTFGIDEEKRDKEAIASAVATWKRTVVQVLKSTLTDGRKYLLGEEFSAADISLSYDLMTAAFTGVTELMDEPLVKEYFERVSARTSYKECYGPQENKGEEESSGKRKREE